MKLSKTRGALTILAAVLLALSPMGAASASQSTTQSDRFSDTEIAQGVLFGDGAFAEEAGLQKLSKQSKAQTAEVKKVEQRLLTTASKDHPKELAAATDKIRTGDPYEVDEGIRELSDVFADAIAKDYPKMSTAAAVNPQCGVICVCVAAVEIAVVAGGAVAIVVETAVGGHFVLWTKSKVWNSSTDPQSGSDLTYDDYVATVAAGAK